jgi:hypothetical protein
MKLSPEKRKREGFIKNYCSPRSLLKDSKKGLFFFAADFFTAGFFAVVFFFAVAMEPSLDV